VLEALGRGYEVACQSRDADRLREFEQVADIFAFDPRDEQGLAAFLAGADVVVMALGVKGRGPTTLFSDTTRVLLEVMRCRQISRLVVVTGVGAGDTRGHGGFLYDRIIYPLFTRNRYQDKERQERLLEASELDWVVVRPAPFSKRPPEGELEVHLAPGPGVVLTCINPAEVARFVVDQFVQTDYLRRKPFIGHR
jgi:putative NADH-flavin reductase